MSEQKSSVEVIPRRRLGDIAAGGPVVAIVPRTIDDVFRVAKAIYIAHLAPDSYVEKKKDVPYSEEEAIARIVIGIMKGAEVGFPPITALSTIAIIRNRPCIWGDGAQALIQDRGHLEKMVVEELGTEPTRIETTQFPDDYGFRVKMWRRGQDEPYIGTFTVRDAKRAHLWMDAKRVPWIEHPKRMLHVRARAFPQRDGFSDDLMGLSIGEEIQDLPPEPPTQTNVDFLEDAPRLAAPDEESHTENAAGPSGSSALGEPVQGAAAGSPPTPDPPPADRPEGERPSPEGKAVTPTPESSPPPSGRRRNKPGMSE